MRSRRHFEIKGSTDRITVSIPRRCSASSLIGSLLLTVTWWGLVSVVATEAIALHDPSFPWIVAVGAVFLWACVSAAVGTALGRRLEVSKEGNVVRRDGRTVATVDAIDHIEVASAWRASPFNWPRIYAVCKDRRRIALVKGEAAAGPLAFANSEGHSAMSIKNELTSTAQEIADYLGVPLEHRAR